MSTIEETALNTYTKNIDYFKKEHPEIYEKIDNLNTNLNSILYTNKYELEYKDEGYFDVLELASKQFLYQQNSLEYSEFLANIINLKNLIKSVKHFIILYIQNQLLKKLLIQMQ